MDVPRMPKAPPHRVLDNSISKQQAKDKSQDRHRKFNSILIMLIFCCAVVSTYIVQDKFLDTDASIQNADKKTETTRQELVVAKKEISARFEELTYEQHKSSEIGQIVADEGYRRCVYADSLGKSTIGFGHLMLPTDKYTCISAEEAVTLLEKDYAYAEDSVDLKYPWAYGEARLVLINMTYQMGATGVSKFKKTLECMQDEDYTCAAIELLDSRWATQTSYRASRLAGRILAIPSK